MTTLLVLYRRPDGGDEALATFERRYRDEHLPLAAGAPGLATFLLVEDASDLLPGT